VGPQPSPQGGRENVQDEPGVLVEAYWVALPVIRSLSYASASAGAAGSTAPVAFVRLTDDGG